MPDFCTCGAQLPPDALFCHKCGKAQREIPVPETLPPPPGIQPPSPPPQAPRVEALPLSFHNPIAVRIGLLMAVAATLLSRFVPILNWVGAGFFAVVLYRHRTGSVLNVGAGARLGMITGVLMGAMSTVVLSLTLIPDALSGKLIPIMEEQMKSIGGAQSAAALQMIHAMNGTDLAIWLFLCMTVAFIFITGLGAAGGALGAKLVGRA